MSQAMTWYQLTDVGMAKFDDTFLAVNPLLTTSSSLEPAYPRLHGLRGLRAMAYGDGFFTTIGVHQGYPLGLRYHQVRVHSHCQALYLYLSLERQNLLWQTVIDSACTIQHGIIKIIVSRADQDLRGYAYSPTLEDNSALIWIGVLQSDPLSAHIATFIPDAISNVMDDVIPDDIKGVSISNQTLMMSSNHNVDLQYSLLENSPKNLDRRVNGDLILQQEPIVATCLTSQLSSLPKPLAGLKTLNRLDSVLIAGELQRVKTVHSEVAEGLVSDMTGHWVEGVSSNVFYQLKPTDSQSQCPKSQWFTPPIEASGVTGTLRQSIMDKFEHANQPVRLRTLTSKDLNNIHSMFFCNAVRGIMPVRELLVNDQRLAMSLQPFA